VRVGLAELADPRRGLAHQLLVDALDDEPGRRLDPEGDPFRRRDDDRVAETERELKVLALGLYAVTDADDLQGLAVTLGDAGDHVVDQRAGQAVQRADLALVVGPGDPDDAVLLDHADRLGDGEVQGALGPLDTDRLAVDGHVHSAGDGNGETSDT